MMIQLDPPVPVSVTSKKNESGSAILVHDFSVDHNPHWAVVMDKTGEIWWVPNNEVRVAKNWTMGRR